MSIDSQHVTVENDDRVLAEALIQTDPEHHSLQASLHVESGHLPPGTRSRLVDAVFDLTAPEPGTDLEFSLPAGDGEILDRLRERCADLETRAAGASTLATGAITAPRP